MTVAFLLTMMGASALAGAVIGFIVGFRGGCYYTADLYDNEGRLPHERG